MGSKTDQALIHPSLEEIDPSIPSGQPWYEEELLGKRFRISGASFFQVNTLQAEVLAEVVRQKLALEPDHVLLDAYAGVGTFAVLLAPYVKRVLAVEESSSAVADAVINQAGIDNIAFYEGKVEAILPELDGAARRRHPRPAPRRLPPGRPGRRPGAWPLRELVYVSCDPATLAASRPARPPGRRAGYRLVDVQPVDMFPQTYHIEVVATLASRPLADREAHPRLRLAATASAPGLPGPAVSRGRPRRGRGRPLGGGRHAGGDGRGPRQRQGPQRRRSRGRGPRPGRRHPGGGRRHRAGQAPRRCRSARPCSAACADREHRVITGLALVDAGRSAVGLVEHVTTAVRMRPYSEDEIEAYIARGEPFDKAGAYAIQDEALPPRRLLRRLLLQRRRPTSASRHPPPPSGQSST